MNKEKIIKESTTYSEIISNKKVVKNKYFSIYYINNNKENKYGITVPKKVGKEHIRNKLKRQIKNIIITNEKDIQIGFYYVIIIKEAALEISYGQMANEILNLFKKVRN